jgi:hypothetical protein
MAGAACFAQRVWLYLSKSPPMRLQFLLLFASACFLFNTPRSSAQCNASFNSTATSVCSGNMVNFVNTSTANSTNTWKVNEVQFSTGINSSYLFPAAGTSTIELVISDGMGCVDSASVVITVNQTPTVNINVSATTLWASDSVYVNFSSSGTVGGAFYYWDFCDGNTAGNASPFYYQWAAPGTTYCVCVELDNNNGCSDADCEINMVVNDDLGVTETAGSDILIYPNPSAGDITIRLGHDTNEFKSITISDHLGRIVRTYEDLEDSYLIIEDNELSGGVYVVKISTEKYEVVRQLIIE